MSHDPSQPDAGGGRGGWDPERSRPHDPASSQRIEYLYAIAGVFVVFALVVFFAIELTNPTDAVLPERTIFIMLGLIGALLGIKTIGGPIKRSDGGENTIGGGGEED